MVSDAWPSLFAAVCPADYFYTLFCLWRYFFVPPVDFAFFQLFNMQCETNCEMQLLSVEKANAPQSSKSIYQRSCRNKSSFWMPGKLRDCNPSTAWSVLEVLETHRDPGDSAGSTVAALPRLLPTLVEGIPVSENRPGQQSPQRCSSSKAFPSLPSTTWSSWDSSLYSWWQKLVTKLAPLLSSDSNGCGREP